MANVLIFPGELFLSGSGYEKPGVAVSELTENSHTAHDGLGVTAIEDEDGALATLFYSGGAYLRKPSGSNGRKSCT